MAKKSEVLYHFTCALHLPSILKEKQLRVTCSNLSPYDFSLKPVVWLTTNKDPDREGNALYSAVDKTEIRITVKRQKHHKYWPTWSRKNKILDWWAESLEKDCNPDTWWVSEKSIPFGDIIKIENLVTGEVYFEQLII